MSGLGPDGKRAGRSSPAPMRVEMMRASDSPVPSPAVNVAPSDPAVAAVQALLKQVDQLQRELASLKAGPSAPPKPGGTDRTVAEVVDDWLARMTASGRWCPVRIQNSTSRVQLWK